MNWYKVATEAAVAVTPAEFRAMTWREKWDLTHSPSLTPEVQLLFFAGEYKRKSEALYNLAWNRSITPEVQRLFFTELYGGKANTLSHLVDNPMFLHDFTLEELLLIRNVVRGAAKLHVLSKRLEQIAGVT